MPISRKKSCVQCRTAKARCNLERICSRCVDRGLRCDYYGSASSRPSPYPERPSVAQNFLGQDSPAPSNSGEDPAISGLADSVPAEENFGVEFREDATLGLTMEQFIESEGTENPMSIMGGTVFPSLDSIECPTSVSSNPSLLLQEQPLANHDFRHHSACYSILDGSSTEADSSSSTSLIRSGLWDWQLLSNPAKFEHAQVCGRHFINVLSQRNKSGTTESFLMSHYVKGQIATYPKMMTQERLPPFIRPFCVGDGRLLETCVVNGTHHCLPESLANCACLVRMFYSRTPQSSPLVWMSIYAEQDRLRREMATYDNEALLAAFQSVIIYVLLQAQDLQFVHQHHIGSLIMTLSDLATTLHKRCDYEINTYERKDLTQKVWAFNECFRRACCLLSVLQTLLNIITDNRDRMDCPNFAHTPLPCPRELWDYSSSEAWASRFKRQLNSKSTHRVLTLADVRKFRASRADAEAKNRDAELMASMASWCEELDDFGTLVWLSALMG